VVNNAIVLIDYINTLRGRGMEQVEAIVTAGNVRRRPILNTTGTMIFGLVPMAPGLGDGAEIRTPFAVTVICVLATSTLLTLVIMPTTYHLAEGMREKFFKAPAAEQPAAGAAEPTM
jgi:HAE1 family hydrophobic/amphiphilic exporter-1